LDPRAAGRAEAEAEGFEPSYADPKSAVLPLDDASMAFRDITTSRALHPR
jgi:hypothetical protein